MAGGQRRLVAILAADVVGYSRLVGADEEGTVARLRALFREVVQPAVAVHRGRVFKLMGDAFLAEFPSAVEAVRCGVAVQEAVAAREADDLRLRIGIHLGDVLVEGGDLLGDGVNVAARLEAEAEPGGIAVSAAVAEAVRGRVPFAIDDLGERTLKNIDRAVRVFRVSVTAAITPQPLTLPDRPSLVVLPFQNLSGDTEQDYFVDGLVEDITTALSRIRWFFVIARNSAFTYKSRVVDVRQVGRDLGVRYVLEGSVRKAGRRVRITCQLVEAAGATHLWAEQFDGTDDDVFALQDRVTEAVAGAIEPNLHLAEAERARHKPTTSVDAYDLYLRAMPHDVPRTREEHEARLSLLRRAVALDPSFALGKARAALLLTEAEHHGWHSHKGEAEGLRLAREALDCANDDPLTLRCAAHALIQAGQDRQRANAAMERAVAVNPNSAFVLGGAGWAMVYAGRCAEALDLLHRAVRLSPRDPDMPRFLQGIGMAHLMLGEYEVALDYGQRAIALAPNRTVGHRVTVVALVVLGRLDQARSAARHYMASAPQGAGVLEQRMFRMFADSAFAALMVRSLRSAGLPE